MVAITNVTKLTWPGTIIGRRTSITRSALHLAPNTSFTVSVLGLVSEQVTSRHSFCSEITTWVRFFFLQTKRPQDHAQVHLHRRGRLSRHLFQIFRLRGHCPHWQYSHLPPPPLAGASHPLAGGSFGRERASSNLDFVTGVANFPGNP